MVSFSLFRVNKEKKVLLPGISCKDLKPVSSLLVPADLIVPMFFVALIAQISDNLKNILDTKDVQNLFSVKAYRKVIFSGFNSMALSVIYSLSRTLGPELETLSVLSVPERIIFLKDLQFKIMIDKNVGKIDFRQRNLNNPFQLMKHRKGLSIQSRSIMVATSIFSPESIVIGTPVSCVDLSLILYSSRMIWLALGLLEEDFEFLLIKDALNKSKILNENLNFLSCSDIINSLKTLFYFELKQVLGFDKFFDVSADNIVFQGDKNSVLLEKELGFVYRSFPNIPEELFIAEEKLDDALLRSALDQRRAYKLSLDNVFKGPAISAQKNTNVIKKVRFKKFLNKN